MNKALDLSVVIRKAQAADIAAMAEIWWQLMAEHDELDPAYWGLIQETEAKANFARWRQEHILDEKHIALVAEIGGRVVGFIHGVIRERVPIYRLTRAGYLNDIALDRAFRRRGIGRALLDALTLEFKARGLDCIELMVDEDNPAAQELYKSSGFYVRQRQMLKKL